MENKEAVKMYWVHHLKSDADRLYLRGTKGGIGLIEVEDCERITVKILGEYLQISKENILAEVGRGDIMKYYTE